ncbi:MAG: efflux RND transporter periplasmic adaptor subunit [Acidobacteria bacterium]|nr:efflux RND transporter periplasmic adaptor subunit [Acidobacteriota bacterium]
MNHEENSKIAAERIDETPSNEAPSLASPNADLPNQDVAKAASTHDASTHDASTNSVSTHDASSNSASTNDAPTLARKRFILVAVLFIIIIATSAILFWVNRSSGKNTTVGRPVPEPAGASVPAPGAETSAVNAPRPGDLVLTLSPDKLENAHLKTELVTMPSPTSTPSGGGLRTAGTVEANAYKEVPVLPVAGGIVREVKAQLGDRVQRGQPLAVIFSTELSEAQSDYLNIQAEIEKHHQHFRRMTELVEIGAASREELEESTAMYKAEQAKISAVKQRLLLFGLSEKQIDAIDAKHTIKPLITVEAPASGVILSRTVNSGEVVMQGKELFRVTDLSTVWVIGQIYESNFANVRVGTAATITAPAFAGRTFTGRISYVDPRVEPQTRTAQVRIEVKNPGEILKLGMFVDVIFGGASTLAANGQRVVNVPRAAVQLIGAKPVVFVATDQAGIFAQREVIAGAEANGSIAIFAGLNGGERIVTEGSFLLRAESLKLNPTQPTTPTKPMAMPANVSTPQAAMPDAPMDAPHNPPTPEAAPKTQAVTVKLNANGYQPASFKLQQGIPARLTFVRTVEATCATELVIPEYGIKRDLPFNEPVVIEFTPTKTGEVKFACGMDMIHGKILVK